MAKATVLLESAKPLLGGGQDVIRFELGAQSMEAAAASVVDNLCRLYGKEWAVAIDRLRELCGMPTSSARAALLEELELEAVDLRSQVEGLADLLEVKDAAISRQIDELTKLRLELEECARYEPAYVSPSAFPLALCTACGEVLTLPTGNVQDASGAHYGACTAQSPDDEPVELRRLYVERAA